MQTERGDRPDEADGPFEDACDLVFVYGTLMRGFPLHRLIEGRAEYVGSGTTKARLLDLGRYPAAAPDLHGTVVGEVYRLRESGLWRVLDSAEGPQYHREGVTIRMADGRSAIDHRPSIILRSALRPQAWRHPRRSAGG